MKFDITRRALFSAAPISLAMVAMGGFVPWRASAMEGSQESIAGNSATRILVDPITLAKILTDAVSILNGLSSAKKQKNMQTTVRNIALKIDEIISQQREILRQIEQFRQYISEQIYLQSKNEIENFLIARRSVFNRLSITPITGANRSDFVNFADDTLIDSIRLGAFDFSAFIAFSGGCTMCLALYLKARVSLKELSSVKMDLSKVVISWLSSDNELGIDVAIKNSIQIVEDNKLFIEKSPKRIILNRVDEQQKNGSFCEVSTVLVISGDFQVGFSGHVLREKSNECYRPQDPDPCSRCPTELSSSLVVLSSVGSEPFPTVPSKSSASTGYREVNILNEIRNKTIDEMDRANKLHFQMISMQSYLDELNKIV